MIRGESHSALRVEAAQASSFMPLHYVFLGAEEEACIFVTSGLLRTVTIFIKRAISREGRQRQGELVAWINGTES